MGVKLQRTVMMGLLLLPLLFGNASQAAPPDMMPVLTTAPWYGSYVCNQGLTRLRLSIHAVPGRSGKLEAEFAFTPDPDNPQVPAGSFHMTGTLDSESRLLTLKQERWTDQPADPSYRMVDLEGKLSQAGGQAMIRGRVTSYGCEDFAVWQFNVSTADAR